MLNCIEIDKSCSFTESSVKDTSYISHNYYTYPARFIPQLASRLINAYTKNGDIVADNFMGSGTTILESIVNQRVAIGTDINELAFLVAKVKTTPIPSVKLFQEFLILENDLKNIFFEKREIYLQKSFSKYSLHEKINYWFKPEQKENLSILLSRILEIENLEIKNFFLVSFSQILKTCSIWLQKSIKPTRDLNKKNSDVLVTFLQNSKKMIQKNDSLNKILSSEVIKNIEKYRILACQDARNIPCENEKVNLIVTSPPYVTSYEYADLHQLPLYWLGYLTELSQYRKKFIGSSYKVREDVPLKSVLANEIVKNLGENKKSREVRNYFSDMLETFVEMHRILKPKAKCCIVIGDTEFNGVKISNAEGVY